MSDPGIGHVERSHRSGTRTGPLRRLWVTTLLAWAFLLNLLSKGESPPLLLLGYSVASSLLLGCSLVIVFLHGRFGYHWQVDRAAIYCSNLFQTVLGRATYSVLGWSAWMGSIAIMLLCEVSPLNMVVLASSSLVAKLVAKSLGWRSARGFAIHELVRSHLQIGDNESAAIKKALEIQSSCEERWEWDAVHPYVADDSSWKASIRSAVAKTNIIRVVANRVGNPCTRSRRMRSS
jgi:hypothetical protein